MTGLADYLSAALDREWKWGELDCFLFCADWVRAATGIDPAFDFRGTYEGPRDARRLIKERGGIEALAARCLERFGFAPTAAPVAGDVGLVRAVLMARGRRAISVPVGAICVRPNTWAVKTRRRGELVARGFPLIRAWRIHG